GSCFTYIGYRLFHSCAKVCVSLLAANHGLVLFYLSFFHFGFITVTIENRHGELRSNKGRGWIKGIHVIEFVGLGLYQVLCCYINRWFHRRGSDTYLLVCLLLLKVERLNICAMSFCFVINFFFGENGNDFR